MPTDDITSPIPDTALDDTIDGPGAAPVSEHGDTPMGPPQPQNEATIREWHGLPPDAVILTPALTSTPPMRSPEGAWAMLVLAVDVIGDNDPEPAGEVALFAGSWMSDQPPADLHDGDLVVRLTWPAYPTRPLRRYRAVDVEMLLAYQGTWRRVGLWYAADDRWPGLVAPTAAAVMGLHGDAVDAVTRVLASPVDTVGLRWASGCLGELLDAGLLNKGDELVWTRPGYGARHTARIRGDGTLLLTDGRVYANPTGATTALGGRHQNGWKAFRRMSDGRSLDELRNDLRARRGQ